MDFSFLRRQAPALSVFGFTFALRLITLWRLGHSAYLAPTTGDMRFYAEWGRRIADGQLSDFHAFYGQPLYAYLLGGIFALTGFQPAIIGVIQAALDALTALLIYKIARLVFDSPAQPGQSGTIIGILAGALWAFFVPAAAYSGLLIATPWLLTGWWFLVWWLLGRSVKARTGEWFLIAAFVGVAAMMSATILFAVPLLFAAAGMRRSLPAGAAIIAGVLVGTAPAWLHNAVIARDPVFLSAHSGVNFWIGNNPEANGYPRVPRALPSDQAALLRESIAIAERDAGHPLPRSGVSAYWSGKAHDYIASHPLAWLRLVGLKAKNFWNAFAYDDLSSITALRDAGIVAPGFGFGLVAVFGLPGCILALRRPRARWIVAVVLLQLIALLPVFVNERYRLCAAPGLLILGTFFLCEFWRALAGFNWKAVGVLAVLLALSGWFVTLPTGEAALGSLDNYKTARRHLAASNFAAAEFRLWRAFEAVVPPARVPSAVARAFGDAARERLEAGDQGSARATLDAATQIDPANAQLAALRRRLSASEGHPEQP